MSIRARLLATSAALFASRLVGAAIMLAVQALIARHYGSAALGRYMVAVATINILAMLMPLGFHTIAAYFAAAYGAKKQGHALRAFARTAMLQTALMAASVLVVAQVLLRTGWLDLPFAPGAITAIVISATAVAFIMLSGAMLTALKHAVLGITGDALVRPLLVALSLAMVLLGAGSDDAIENLLKTQSGLFAILAAAAIVVTSLVLKPVPDGDNTLKSERRRWWFYAAPWAIVALANDFFFDIATLHLTGFLGYADLAVFGIACRLFALAAFAVGTVYAISMPEIFEAEADGRREEFLQRIRSINRSAAMLALAIVLSVPIVAPFVLRLLGPEFEAATGPLSVLCLVLLVRAIMGPAALVLSLERRPYVQLWAVAAGFLALLIGNHWFVPQFGLYGACYSAVIATTIWSVTMWWLAKRLTGIDVSIGLWPIRTATAGAISTSVGP